uniref:M48 family metallopeptidase n=1 Tax=uncultured Acinetobacter sp. TaxID=165433 RepID=UPI00262D956D|nr:SprT family zinc-dependent metalloprotease [uncultured Acinetobacter sp.]
MILKQTEQFSPLLPEIHMVRHARAKRLKLTVSAQSIRLTVPPHATKRQVQDFLLQSQVWLEQTWLKQQLLTSQKAEQSTQIELPTTLNLNFFPKTIRVEYQSMSRAFKWSESELLLIINTERAEQALTQFVFQFAKQVLPEPLNYFATLHQRKVNTVRISKAKTRWGSCSSDQRIMLHAGLLLMPLESAEYVILHELAHTVHMHHQTSFWQQLEQWCPQAKLKQKRLKQYRLPDWWQA